MIVAAAAILSLFAITHFRYGAPPPHGQVTPELAPQTDPDPLATEPLPLPPSASEQIAALLMGQVVDVDPEGDLVRRILRRLPARDADAVSSVLQQAHIRAPGQSPVLAETGTDELLLMLMAVIAATTNPEGAFQLSYQIPSHRLRTAWQQAVMETWALVDARSALRWMAESRFDALDRPSIFAVLAASDPHLLLEVAESLSDGSRLLAEEVALIAVARRDVRSALDYLSDIIAADAPARAANALRAVGTGYAHFNTEAAWEWAVALDHRGATAALVGVLEVMMEMNLERAVQLSTQLTLEEQRAGILARIFGPPPRDRITTFRAAESGLWLAGDAATDWLRVVLGQWATADPDAALEWALIHAYRADAATMFEIVGTAAHSLAPEFVIDAMYYVPYPYRGGWLATAESHQLDDAAVASTTPASAQAPQQQAAVSESHTSVLQTRADANEIDDTGVLALATALLDMLELPDDRQNSPAPGLAEHMQRATLPELLKWRVHTDPYTALDEVRRLDVDDPIRDITLRNVVRQWVLIDPVESLRGAELLRGRARDAWLEHAVAEWALVDPESLLDFLERRHPDMPLAGAVFHALSSADLIRAYEQRIRRVAGQLPVYWRVALENRIRHLVEAPD